MNRWIRAATLAAAVLLLTGGAHGAATITYTPTGPINYGSLMTYSIDNAAGPIESYIWTYSSGGCPDKSFYLSPTYTTATQSVYEGVPGSFTIKCQITYMTNSGGGRPAPEAPTLSITVPKPDGAVVNKGNKQSVQVGQYNTTEFGVTCSGKSCGYIGGLAQERITNAKDGNGNPIRGVGNWVPSTGNDDRFIVNSNTIIDKKIIANDAIYNSAVVGGTFLTATQELRIMIKDPCGGPDIECKLGSFSLTGVRDTAWTYMIIHN